MTMRDPMTPVPGRTFYAGRWRTPEEVERRRTLTRVNSQTHKARARRSSSYRERYALDPEFRAAELERNRSNYKPRIRRTALDPAERERRSTVKRIAAIERRRAAADARAEAKVRARASSKRAPSRVRQAWSQAQPGSIMRIKFPTMADLDASARRGEWDGWSG